MFDRYTEQARRMIFFARQEASDFGSPYIETEHLLLGMLRDKGVVIRYLAGNNPDAQIRELLSRAGIARPPIPTSVDLPLSTECKHVLAYAAEEADRLKHEHIGTEHLLLGMLREEKCLAAKLLRERGLTVDRTRIMLATAEPEATPVFGVARGYDRQSLASIDFVEADTAELLLTSQHSSLLPRIGETVSIHKPGAPKSFYKVRDLIWEFDWNAAGSWLKNVIVSVAKDGA